MILGAYNPPLAQRTLSSAPEVGIMPPCNITIEKRESDVSISIVNSETMMTMGDLGENAALREVAAEIRSKLERVTRKLSP